MSNKNVWSANLGPELLAKQCEFFNTRISHPRLEEAISDMLPLLTPHSESNLIFVVGATGVGKSALCRFALKTLYREMATRTDIGESVIPIVSIEAATNGESRHTFRGIYEDLLSELDEPCLDKKQFVISDGENIRIKPARRTSIADLRKSLESALQCRRTEVCVIDEAYHLLRLAKDTAVLDTLKSLANTTGSKIVLVGSYDLFDLASSHAQVARRASIIHFDRYHCESPDDRKAFRSVVRSLMGKWPCEEVPSLVAIADDLMEINLGCVGLLKSMMLDASAMQLRNKGTWDPHFLVRAAKANKLREVIRKEIEAGERKVLDALVGESLWDEKALVRLTAKMAEYRV